MIGIIEKQLEYFFNNTAPRLYILSFFVYFTLCSAAEVLNKSILFPLETWASNSSLVVKILLIPISKIISSQSILIENGNPLLIIFSICMALFIQFISKVILKKIHCVSYDDIKDKCILFYREGISIDSSNINRFVLSQQIEKSIDQKKYVFSCIQFLHEINILFVLYSIISLPFSLYDFFVLFFLCALLLISTYISNIYFLNIVWRTCYIYGIRLKIDS